MLVVRNEQTFPVQVQKIKQNARTILAALDYEDFDLGILLATPEVIQEYNRTYRHKDKPTDIISFSYHQVIPGERIIAQSDEDKNLGDLIICPSYVHDDLERWGQTFEQRMNVLLVHGICHLLGYDHEKDEDYEVMKMQEDYLLEKISS
jgi:rRNA maturation RNase YbeY